MTPDNFLAAEPLIAARLRETLASSVHILSAAELSQMAYATQPTPAVHVLYQGYRVSEAKVHAFVGVVQHWLTVVACRNVRSISTGVDARQDAGPIAVQVIDALHRYRLALPGAMPLQFESAPAPGFADGHYYLPLAWAVPFNLERSSCPS